MARNISEGLSHRKGRRKEAHPDKSAPAPQAPASPSIDDLTPEELAVIRKMRQKKEAVEYTVTAAADVKILDTGRTISNNIFNIHFQGSALTGPLEAFMTDPDGKTISNMKEFTPDGSSQKVTFLLQSNSGYDPKAEYFLIVRKKGAGTEAVLKEPYTINISFASDFDF